MLCVLTTCLECSEKLHAGIRFILSLIEDSSCVFLLTSIPFALLRLRILELGTAQFVRSMKKMCIYLSNIIFTFIYL